jgi:hypothetical protein
MIKVFKVTLGNKVLAKFAQQADAENFRAWVSMRANIEPKKLKVLMDMRLEIM